MAATAADVKLFRGTVSDVWQRIRPCFAWYEFSRPKLENMDVIVDITWGPHRRVAAFGVPSRPRKLESHIYQVVVAYRRTESGGREFIPGTLRVQRVQCKNATYNADILETIVGRSCRVTTDQGGEWARLKHRFAEHKTVNHRLE